MAIGVACASNGCREASSQSVNLKRGKSAPRQRRVGRVTLYPRGSVWYMYYYESGRRIRRRIGCSLDEARLLAAQVNAQLETGAPAMLSFEPLSVEELRRRWLDNHEHIMRSSVATISRYRSATQHLLTFVARHLSISSADRLALTHAEAFTRYLRQIRVAPNGHPKAAKVALRDKGILFILETCRALFNYALKHKHLPPYHENPFGQLRLDRLPIENAKPIEPFDEEQERLFFAKCDAWQLPIFLTLALTGLRPGELTHLLVPEDVDLAERVIFVRNKVELGWKTKTRNQRTVPLSEELCTVLKQVMGDRRTGPVFLRRRFVTGKDTPLLHELGCKQLAMELERRRQSEMSGQEENWSRRDDDRLARRLWRDAGAIKTDRLRMEFIKVTGRMGMPEATCPKVLRHLFATCLQDANVDPLIRQELMGHAANGRKADRNGGLGMTAVYTHTRDATRRAQLQTAMELRKPAIEAAQGWLNDAGRRD
ncbi:MAG: tyrosine-type recombinase/integrase [Phycisphaerae bacterium]|nr:tyrosine-type recombinase/integrase [Phycisphaerae bacterium]